MTTNTHIAAQARKAADAMESPGFMADTAVLTDLLRRAAQALEAAPALDAQGEARRWQQLVHMVDRGVAPHILVDWINHPERLDKAAELRAQHG